MDRHRIGRSSDVKRVLSRRPADTGYRDAFPLERRVTPRNANWTRGSTRGRVRALSDTIYSD